MALTLCEGFVALCVHFGSRSLALTRACAPRSITTCTSLNFVIGVAYMFPEVLMQCTALTKVCSDMMHHLGHDCANVSQIAQAL